jgi:hypothetical protein
MKVSSQIGGRFEVLHNLNEDRNDLKFFTNWTFLHETLMYTSLVVKTRDFACDKFHFRCYLVGLFIGCHLGDS